jgi:hypothetical protein
MGDLAQIQFDMIPSFLGVPVGDLEDLMPGQVAIAGYFCDNLDRPMAGQRYLARQLRYASQPETVLAKTTDLGDVNVFPLEPDKHFSAVISQCEAVLEVGARLVLVGGDSSGLKALGIAVGKITGEDASIVPVTGGITDNLSKTQPIILSVEMIAQIDATPGNVVAAAVFGLAAALDSWGSTETRAALTILKAVAERLEKGAH